MIKYSQREMKEDKLQQLISTIQDVKMTTMQGSEEIEKGNQIFSRMEEIGNQLKKQLEEAERKLNNATREESDWNVYYIILIEFVLFILIIFL